MNCRVSLAKNILMFMKNSITIEDEHYCVIYYPFKKFSKIRNFKFWNYLSYLSLFGTIPVSNDLSMMPVNGYLMDSIVSFSSLENMPS